VGCGTFNKSVAAETDHSNDEGGNWGEAIGELMRERDGNCLAGQGESAGFGWHFVLYTFADRVPPGWNSEPVELRVRGDSLGWNFVTNVRWWKCPLSTR
jgi:hypothetical protein